MIFIASVLCGCSTSPKILSASNISQDEAFRSGLVRLDCIWGCGWKAGLHIRELQELYLTQNWTALSQLVLNIGFGGDIGYFYLGAAAEGLGYDSAAITYYQLGNYSPEKCNKVTELPCQGHRFPDEFNKRIYALQNQKRINQVKSSLICKTNADCLSNQTCRSLPGAGSECRDNTSPQTGGSQTLPIPPQVNPGIDTIKKKCIELGFETNTEKFNTCVEKSSK